MRDYLDDWEKNINRWFAAKAYSARKDIHDLTHPFGSKPRTWVVALRARCYDERQTLGAALTPYADNVRVLKHANYAIATTDKVPSLTGIIGSWHARTICIPGLERRTFTQCARRCSVDISHLEQIGVPAAHHVTSGNGIKVAVIDTGADDSHDELRNRIVDAYNTFNDTPAAYDDNGHGTHVAGLVAGKNVGSAPAASLYIAKVLDANGSGTEATIALGIDWAIERKVQLINMSLGSKTPSQLEEDLMRACNNNNITVFASAGNNAYGKNYPSSYPGVISVAAVDQHNNHAPFSNIDETVDISAPGVDVVSCVPGGYAAFSGTSMASPLACGVGALVAATNCPNIEETLKATAHPLGRRDTYGAGLIRADAAIGALVHKKYNRQREAIRPWQ